MAKDIRLVREIPAPGDSLPRARASTELAVRDWLDTQARIVSYWRDLLVDRNGDLDLIEALDAHEMFLRSAAS